MDTKTENSGSEGPGFQAGHFECTITKEELITILDHYYAGFPTTGNNACADAIKAAIDKSIIRRTNYGTDN